MSDLNDPIAVVGSSPFAALLSGLLAADHRRGVALVAVDLGRQRLPTGLSGFHAPVTRPDTWQVKRELRRQSLRWVERLAPGAAQRCETLMLASGGAAADALEHIRNVAAGFQVPVERIAHPDDPDDLAYRLDDGWAVDWQRFQSGAGSELNRLGVHLIDTDGRLDIHADGSARLGAETFGSVVLADDAAIHRHLPATEIASLATVETASFLMCSPGRAGFEGMVFDLDTGTAAYRRSDGAVGILAPGDEMAARAAAAALPGASDLRLGGVRRFATLRTRDGAAVIGRPSGDGATVVMGLGALDLALAPAIARYLVGTASPLEHQWCVQRGPNREFGTAPVADFRGPMVSGQAA